MHMEGTACRHQCIQLTVQTAWSRQQTRLTTSCLRSIRQQGWSALSLMLLVSFALRKIPAPVEFWGKRRPPPPKVDFLPGLSHLSPFHR